MSRRGTILLLTLGALLGMGRHAGAQDDATGRAGEEAALVAPASPAGSGGETTPGSAAAPSDAAAGDAPEEASIPGVPEKSSRSSTLEESTRPERFLGRTISAVEVRMMGPTRGRNPREGIVAQVGQPLSLQQISRSLELIYRQGAVADVLAEAEAVGSDQVLVRFKVWPAVLVRRVRFVGNRVFVDRKLQEQLTLRVGSVYLYAEAKSQASLLTRFYQLEGYLQAHVQVEAAASGRAEMDVTYRIEEGPQVRIHQIAFQGAEVFSPRTLQQLTGLEEGRGFRPRSLDEIRQMLMRFYRRERHLEARIRVSSEVSEDKSLVTLHFDIDEGPRIRLEFWRIRPPEAGPFGGAVWHGLLKLLPFAPKDGEPRPVGWLARQDLLRILDVASEQQFSSAFGEEAADRLRTAKIAEGYNGARVDVEYRTSEDGREAAFRFVIDPGQRVRLRDVRFEGNAFYSAELLEAVFREAMEYYTKKDTYTSEALEQALVLLSDYYRSQGLLDVRISRTVELTESALGSRAAVHLQIEEGPRTLVRSVEVRILTHGEAGGNGRAQTGSSLSSGDTTGGATAPVLAESDLAALVTLAPGEPYDPARVRASVEAIQSRYAQLGHIYARVDVTREAINGTPTDVAVRFVVEPGAQARFGEVIVRGARRTRPSVITRELTLQPGGVYEPSALEQSRRNLSSRGLFQRVSIYPVAGERVRDMMVEVEERKAISAALSLGFQFDGFSLNLASARFDSSLELTHHNVGGWGHKASLRFDLASSYLPGLPSRGDLPLFPDYLQDVGLDMLSYLDKASSRRLVLTYQAPNLLGRRVSSTTTGTFFERDRLPSWLMHRNSLAWAFSVDLSSRINLYLQAQAALRRPGVDETDPAMRIWDLDEQVRLYGLGSSVLVFDGRDDRLNPSRGYQISLTSEVGQSYGCGSQWEWNRLTPCPEGSFSAQEAHVRASLSASVLWSYEKWVRLEARGQSGYLHPFGTEDGAVPIEKRFFLGGASTVRGFEQNALGPHRFRQDVIPSPVITAGTPVPTGGNAMAWYSTELILPLDNYASALEDLELALFRDAGNVFWWGAPREAFNRSAGADQLEDAYPTALASSCYEISNSTALRTSVGLGVRWRTSVGPLRFDVGFPRESLCPSREPSWMLHLSIGSL